MDSRTFALQRSRRFGTDNPTRMDCEFWIHMIRTGASAYSARLEFDPGGDRCGGEPVWCFDRFGGTRTALPDGRIVCIGGEHEDFYDPDFCIYNDVVVLAPDGGIEIYGYPREVFPPTDFHTAALVDGRIVIIGCLGYKDERRPGHTPVYELDPATWQIAPLPASGTMPGWLFKHAAQAGPDGTIIVTGGELFVGGDHRRAYPANTEDYELDCRTGTWRCLTARSWKQFHIRADDPRLPAVSLSNYVKIEECVPPEFGPAELPDDEYRRATFTVAGVPILIELDFSAGIRLIVQGQLPAERLQQVLAKVRMRLQAAVEQTCTIDEIG